MGRGGAGRSRAARTGDRTRVAAYIDDDLLTWLDGLCKTNERSRSWMIERALRSMRDEYDESGKDGSDDA